MAADEWTDGAFASRKSKRYTGNWADFTGQFGLSRAVLLKNTHSSFLFRILDNNMAIFNPNENASDFQPKRVGSKCNKSIQRIPSFHGLNTCDPKRISKANHLQFNSTYSEVAFCWVHDQFLFCYISSHHGESLTYRI